MNANDIWVGNDYAYFPNRGRGENYRKYNNYNVVRVKAMRVTKRKPDYFSERLSSYVECQFLDVDGNPRTLKSGEEIIREVAAREIVSDWDEYWNEYEVRSERARKIEEERVRIEAEEGRENELIFARLAMRGVKAETVQVARNGGAITIPREEVKRWLGIQSI